MRTITIVFNFILLFSISTQAQNISVSMHDINHYPQGSDVASCIVFNGKLYFTANNGYSGNELWVYDGANPPSLASDLVGGSLSPYNLTPFNNKLFFGGSGSGIGSEFWSYDEVNGTVLVADIDPGWDGSFPIDFTEFNGKLYFFAKTDDAGGRDIWVYDGINPPYIEVYLNDATYAIGGHLGVFNNKLYYGDHNANDDTEVWAYDGTNPPVMIDSLTVPYNGEPSHFTEFNNKLYYLCGDTAGVERIWEYDGINPPTVLSGIYPNSNGSTVSFLDRYLPYFVEFDSKLFFSAGDTLILGNDEIIIESELWVYDGVNPPSLVMDINPGMESSSPKAYSIYQNKLYFSADNGTLGRELWVYDGVTPPSLAYDIFSGSPSAEVSALAPYNGNLYFAASDAITGVELWEYDGISSPKARADLKKWNNSSAPAHFTEAFGNLYFTAGVTLNKRALFQYVENDIPILIDTIGPTYSFDTLNNKLYFITDEGSYENLRVYDGINPPSLVHSIPQQFGNLSFQNEVLSHDNKLYFAGNDSLYGHELWVYDGANPPNRVADIYDGPSSSGTVQLTSFQGAVYFSCTDGINGRELWKYDGVNPPFMLHEPFPGIGGSNPDIIGEFMGSLYFISNDGPTSEVLYAYDGVNPPTSIVNLTTLTGTRSIGFFKEHNNFLYFKALNVNGSGREELWQFDGINPPTFVTEISSENSGSKYLESFNGQLYFPAKESTYGNELWAYNEIDPPYLVYDIFKGEESASPEWLYAFGDNLLFSAIDGFHGRELWELSTCLLPSTCCQASFYHYPDTSGQYSLTVVNTSSGDNLSYFWEFGDNSTSTDSFPTHTYAVSGTYQLCLTISNTSGTCNDTFCENLLVSSKKNTPLTINVIPPPEDFNVSTTNLPKESSFDLHIFPNPTREILYLQSSATERFDLRIYDLTGRLLFHQNNENQVALHQLPSGLYILEVIHDGQKRLKKFVKH